MRFLRILPLLLTITCAGTPPPRSAQATASPSTSVQTTTPSSASVALPIPATQPTQEPLAPPPAAPQFPYDEASRSRLTATLTQILNEPFSKTMIHGIEILDVETNTVLFTQEEKELLTPASNTKLFTTLGALDLLGPQHRPQVDFALAGVHKHYAETLIIDAHLCPFGEPFGTIAQAAEPLIQHLRQQGIRRIDRLVIRTPALVAPDRFQELNLNQHRERTAIRLRKALIGAKIKLGKLASKEPEQSTIVASYQGPTLAQWIIPINHLSHNGFADGLSQYLGLIQGKSVGYAEGTRLVLDAMHARKIEDITLSDGSGLSRQNKVSAHNIALLLQSARDNAPFLASLAVAGEPGTLLGRLKDSPLLGHVRGKTGTLKEVVATSGYLDHPIDGRRYIFAIVSNDFQEGKGPEVRQLHDALLRALGGDWMTSPSPR